MRNTLTGTALAVVLLQAAPVFSQEYIAGLEPEHRPEHAPTVTRFVQTDAWRAKALKGVTAPHPSNVTAFLKDQEAWFNPFLYPGMPGYYDIRGLHKSKN